MMRSLRGPRQIPNSPTESLARMDGIDLPILGDPDNLVNREVSLERSFALADLVRLVRFEPAERQGVFLGIDREGPQPQLVAALKLRIVIFERLATRRFLKLDPLAGWLCSWGVRDSKRSPALCTGL